MSGGQQRVIQAGGTATGEPRFLVGLTLEEFEELVALIDDEPVDEHLLRVIKKRLRRKIKAIDKGAKPPTHHAEFAQTDWQEDGYPEEM